MDVKQLEYFVVVAEELNITRAAKILMMSQPPLSKQIQNLEEETGVRLFVRGKRSLALTEEGKFLYRRAKDILNLVDKTKSELLNMNRGLGGTISIGLVEGERPRRFGHLWQRPGVRRSHCDAHRGRQRA